MGAKQKAIDKQSVMVVEDSEPDIDALVACLGGNYQVRVATDGDSALQSMREDTPDIVLLDILMPGMDGFEVCRQIKADPKLQDVLIIFVTSLTDAVDETKGLELGAVDYITKPFNFAVIRAKIKTHLALALAKKKLSYQNRILKENIELREQVEQIHRHDLKTPIQVVLGAAQIMLNAEAMDETNRQKLLQEQINACFTMIDMLNRTMVLYKMEQNNCPVNVTPVDIMPVFDRISTAFGKSMAQKQVQLNISINGAPADADTPCIISCDEMLFYIMINNLFSNALEASPNGGSVAIRILGPARGDIKIEIENQGLIPKPIRHKFFDKFVTYGKSQGTGIGTYSAKLMAQLHGGSIHFSLSKQTGTTTIAVNLPQ
nr:hybrid sensor histidine kinase/response regulator [uncultured Desulfobacter sp.]